MVPSTSRFTASLLLILTTSLLLAGCATRVPDEMKNEHQLYEDARDALDRGRYIQAVERLQALESRFPFGKYGEQAQLELVYAYYQNGQYEAAKATANRFVRLNPDHPQLDYVLYLRGLASWDAGRHALEGLELTDLSLRDPGATRDAYTDFSQLVQQFPNSSYAPDAIQRMRYLKNLLAEQEVYIGRFHLRRGAPIAAINRGQGVLEGYADTPAVPDALAVMIEGYLHLQQSDEATRLQQLLQQLAPDHPQLDTDGFTQLYPADKPDKSLWQIITFDLFGG